MGFYDAELITDRAYFHTLGTEWICPLLYFGLGSSQETPTLPFLATQTKKKSMI